MRIVLVYFGFILVLIFWISTWPEPTRSPPHSNEYYRDMELGKYRAIRDRRPPIEGISMLPDYMDDIEQEPFRSVAAVIGVGPVGPNPLSRALPDPHDWHYVVVHHKYLDRTCNNEFRTALHKAMMDSVSPLIDELRYSHSELTHFTKKLDESEGEEKQEFLDRIRVLRLEIQDLTEYLEQLREIKTEENL